MVNTLWLPVVVPHGDDNSDADVLIAASSSGPPRWSGGCAAPHARQRTRLAREATQTTMVAATHATIYGDVLIQTDAVPNIVPAPVMYGAPAHVCVLTTTTPQWSNRMLQHLQFTVRLHPRCTSTRGRVCGTRADFLDLPVPVV